MPENEEADAVMLRTPAHVSADPLSELFPSLTDEQVAEYAKYIGSAAEGKEQTWGVWARTRNLNAQDSDPFRPEDVPPKPAAEIGLWFKF